MFLNEIFFKAKQLVVSCRFGCSLRTGEFVRPEGKRVLGQ